ncbi:MAG: hypothetical protein GIKADHBN_01552 [Phycisphaerales bacterium]|nr:hypothetical protein [Phycisphaerales bacterium]
MRTVPDVVLSFGPLRIDAARLHRGQIAARSSAWLDRSTVEQAWENELTTLDATLAQLMRAVGARPGSDAVIEYCNCDTTVDVFGIHPEGDVIEGARKLLGEASDIDLTANPSAAAHLGCTTEGSTTQHLVLCTADQDSRTDALRQWAIKAGLKPLAYVPVEAAAIQVVVKEALEAGDGGPRVFIHLGEQRTAIVLVNQNELKLVRCVNIGMVSLVDAAAEAQNTSGQVVDAGQRRNGYDVLRRTGVGTGTGGRSHRSDGSDRLLPYLNPALQRYVVEIRQSLRFGFTPQDAARATLVLRGPGSVIPGLGETLAAQLEVVCEASSTAAVEQSAAVDLGLSLQVDPVKLSLTPASHRRAKQTRRSMVGVTAGALAALAVAASDAAVVWHQTSRQRDKAEAMAPRLDELKQRAAQFAHLTELRRENAEIYRAIRTGLGAQPDWKLVLSELSTAALEDMRLTEISAGSGPGGATLSVRGLMPAASDAARNPGDSGSPIARFVSLLGRSAAVESAELGETRTTQVRDVPVEYFAADVRLRGIPFRVAEKEDR